LFPRFEPEVADDDARALLAEVRRFMRTVDAKAADDASGFPPAVLDTARSLGLFALTIPSAHGGLGLSLETACVVIDTIATVDRSLAITIGLHAGLGTRAVVELATSAVQDVWLPRLAAGTCVGAFAATESGAGSDLMAVRTTLAPSGDELVLDGEKSFVTNGGFAGVFTVLARSPALGGERAHSLVLVPADSAGVVVGREEKKLGIRASSTTTVRFDGVRVPRAHVLGTPGRGMDHAHDVLAWGRTLMAAGCVGTVRAALGATLGHVTTRRQFGRTIGSQPASREHVATMASKLCAMDALVRYVARQTDPRMLGALSPIAKVFCSEEAFAVCDQAVQLHGALGFLEPFGVARMLRDCRVTRIFEGANDVLLVRLGLARATAKESWSGAAMGAPSGARDLAARLDGVVDRLRARYGVNLVRHQTILQHLARAEMYLSAACATWSRGFTTFDATLVQLAVEDLLTRAGHHLDAIGPAEAREDRVLAITERLYGTPAADARPANTEVSP